MQKLEATTRRLYQRWYQDGIGEIVQGGLFTVLALYFLIVATVPQDSALGQVLPLLYSVVLIAGVLMLRKLIQRIKERVTYPRTGYVEYRRDGVVRRRSLFARMGVGALIAAAIVLAGIYAPGAIAWTYVLQGIIFGMLFFYIGWKMGVMRFYLLAGVCVVAGITVALLPLAEIWKLVLFFAAIGLVQAATGTVTLVHYLKHNPLEDEEPPETGEPHDG